MSEQVEALKECAKSCDRQDDRAQAMRAVAWLKRQQMIVLTMAAGNRQVVLDHAVEGAHDAIEKKDTVLALGCAQLAHVLLVTSMTSPNFREEMLQGEMKQKMLKLVAKARERLADPDWWPTPVPRNGIEYELSMCEKGLKILPDDAGEGAELAAEVLTELLASAASLSIKGSLLSSLGKAASFMVEQGIAAAEGQIFQLALNFEA